MPIAPRVRSARVIAAREPAPQAISLVLRAGPGECPLPHKPRPCRHCPTCLSHDSARFHRSRLPSGKMTYAMWLTCSTQECCTTSSAQLLSIPFTLPLASRQIGASHLFGEAPRCARELLEHRRAYATHHLLH